RLEAQLQHAQKMEAVGTLAGGIAHDFNNLLMGIQGYTSIMLMKVGEDHPFYAKLRSIEKYVQSGAELTRQLLGFSRKDDFDVAPVQLNDLVRDTVGMFGRTKKEIRIHEDYAGDLRPVAVDRGQMEQVLMNLFVNAWQAMPEGGDLYLETRNVELDRTAVRPIGGKPGHYVKVIVRDTGTGMEEKVRRRIFEPFFTTKKKGGGTGLGLASAYGIIRNHGGIIDVQSRPRRGTQFEILLPAAATAALAQAPEPAEVRRILEGPETILLVDDEEMVTEVGSEILKELGYEVLVARSGKEALEAYARDRDRIDLVILDMIMPGMGGAETFTALQEIDPRVCVLLSSGYSEDGQARRILEQGCRGFIQKPFNVRTLAEKMREILDGQAA
ncbi:MAG: response regulator, partial [Deltaproteobacteria bacterium]|nr:response regulator [Deltaproteobacteria bacterium]